MIRQNRSDEGLSTYRSAPKRRQERVRKEPSSPILRLLRGAGIGILSGGLAAVFLLLMTAWIVSKQSDPDLFLYPAALLVLFLTSTLSGIVAQRAAGSPFLHTGLVTAALWVLLTFLSSLVTGTGNGALPSVYAWALHIPQVLFVLLGAFLAKSRPRKIDSRRRHR